MLRYTTENVGKYWDDENYRIFSMKMNSENQLVLLTSNKTNRNLYGWSSNCLGKILYDILEPGYVDHWQERYIEWKDLGITSYIAYFENDLLGWETTIEIVNDMLFGIGKKIDKSIYDGHEFFNHYYVQQEDFIIVTLCCEKESFFIETVTTSLSFSDLDLSNFKGKDISYITQFSSNIIDKNIYKKCIQLNKTIHFVEHFKYNDANMFLDVFLYPDLINSKILVCTKRVDEKEFFNIFRHVRCIKDTYPKTTLPGVCQINYKDTFVPYIIGCNQRFKKIIEETDLKLSEIIENDVFQQCKKNKSKESGRLVLQNKAGHKLFYNITVKQLSELDDCTYIMEILPNYIVQNMLSQLSLREQEILSYVAEGNTNRYISSKLNISEGTVKKTIHNAFKKFGISSRIEFIKLMYK